MFLKDFHKQKYNCDDNELLLLRRCTHNSHYFTSYMGMSQTQRPGDELSKNKQNKFLRNISLTSL